MTRPPLGIVWQTGSYSGWGVYGVQLMLELARKRDYLPVPIYPLDNVVLSPLHASLLEGARQAHDWIRGVLEHDPARSLKVRFPLLHALGNRMALSCHSQRVSGEPDFGLMFLEDTNLGAAERAIGQRFARMVAGSSWNARVLEGLGLDNVVTCLQGIDPTLFHPAPASGLLHSRFVVFSGGKLEYRKGQDIVIAAFRRFQQRHPDALLVAAWYNPWPETMAGLAASPHLDGPPAADDQGRLDVSGWLLRQGLPPESFRVVGAVPNTMMAQIMREADAALFPNRCEGGTNLVAMECLASGVPTILSANTGHLDLIGRIPCLALTRQQPVTPEMPGQGTEGWGESDVDEVVAALETLYTDRSRAMGQAAAQAMTGLTWAGQIDRLLTLLGLRGG